MTVQHRIGNHMQYQTLIQGAAALAWLTSWVTDHEAEIAADGENGHALVPITPVHVEGCQYQLNCVYHMTNTNQGEFLAAFQQIVDTIVNGALAHAECDTEFGNEEE